MTTHPSPEELPDDLRAHAQRLADATGTTLSNLLAAATNMPTASEALAVGWSEALEDGAGR